MFNKNYLNMIASFLILLAQSLFSQIVLQGTVTDNGGEYLGNGAEPIAKALVTVTDQSDASRFFSTYTNDQGQYTIQITETGVVNRPSQIPSKFRLLQNYPNPFNPSTVICYELSQPCRVTIDIYNVLGQKIKTLLDDFQSASGQVVWDATDDRHQGVPAGLYIYSMKVGDRRWNKKMLLIDGQQSSASSFPVNQTEDAAESSGILNKPMSDQYILQVTGEDISPYEQRDLLITENMDLDITVYRTVKDIDSNIYRTVKIVDQWWIAENFKGTHYRNGDAIPNVTDNTEWLNLTTGAYCDYNNEPDSAATWGRFYNWFTVKDSRNVAPVGWHVPSDSDWKELEMALGMSQSEADVLGYRGTNEGSKLAGNAALWYGGDLENNTAFGESGFTALPAGYRASNNGNFHYLGGDAVFWSVSENGSSRSWLRRLYSEYSKVYRSNWENQYGLSVRLVRD